jgi:hypothetical protein
MSPSYTLRRRLAGAGIVVLLLVGLAAWLFAFEEGRWVGRVTSRPETLNLEAVEQGNLPVNQFVSLRDHWAVYREHAETFRLDAAAEGGQRIETLYYPVISDMNPYLLELAGLSRAFGGIDGIPSDEWPRIERMGVLVRTDSVQSLKNVPPLIEFPDGLFGTVLHAETDLPGDERALLSERWPDIDLARVIIINAGHRPGNVWSMIAYGLLGSVSWAGGLILAWRLWRRPRVSHSARHSDGARQTPHETSPSTFPANPSLARKDENWKGSQRDSGDGRPLSYAEALNRYAPQHEEAPRQGDGQTPPLSGIHARRDD